MRVKVTVILNLPEAMEEDPVLVASGLVLDCLSRVEAPVSFVGVEQAVAS